MMPMSRPERLILYMLGASFELAGQWPSVAFLVWISTCLWSVDYFWQWVLALRGMPWVSLLAITLAGIVLGGIGKTLTERARRERQAGREPEEAG